MKKKLAKVLTAGVMTFCMVGCSSTTTEVIKAGTILDNLFFFRDNILGLLKQC